MPRLDHEGRTLQSVRSVVLMILFASGCYDSHGLDPPPVGRDAGGSPPPSVRFVAIEAGGQFTCALTETGRLFCWGANGGGRLGVGSDEPEIFAPREVRLEQPLRSISAGSSHICGVGTDESLWCWGSNANLALGTGDDEDRDRPTRLALPAVRRVAAGAFHTCAVDRAERVYCWGSNSHGQCGVEGPARVPAAGAPVLEGVNELALGERHSCAVRHGSGMGTVWCWGANERGQLGVGTGPDSAAPIRVPAAGAVRIAAGGSTTCNYDHHSVPDCWGANEHGQIGDGARVDRSVPTFATELADFFPWDVALGDHDHACMRALSGEVECWGFNGSGRLGDGTEEERLTPVRVMLPEIAQVTAGQGHSCAVTTDGRAFCWGLNLSGQVGVSPEGTEPLPVEVRFE